METHWYRRLFTSESARPVVVCSLASLLMAAVLAITILRVDQHTQGILDKRNLEKEAALAGKVDAMPVENLKEFVVEDSKLIGQLLDYLAFMSTFSWKIVGGLLWLALANLLVLLWALFRPSPAREVPPNKVLQRTGE